MNEGQAIFDPGIAPRVIAATGASQAKRPFPVLTEREYEILDRLARGLRNDAISARMGISIKTVQNQDGAEQRVDDSAQARRHRARPGRCLARDAGMGRRP